MTSLLRHIATTATAIALLLSIHTEAAAQRRITPVDNPSTATQAVKRIAEPGDTMVRPPSVVEMTDSQGHKILVDTIAGTEWTDTLATQRRVPRMEQPLLFGAAVSLDVAAPLMRAMGRHYGIAEMGAELNLHNRYIPTLEVGLGQASNTPEGNNYTYRTPLTPYFRIGCNYNFIYNSNPDRVFVAGVRYGLSPFSFDVTDVTPPPNYWGESETFDIPRQHLTVGYFQFLLGLRLRIAGPIALGWTVRYQAILHQSASPHGDPWYVPGYGTTGSRLGFTFSVTYLIPLTSSRIN